MKNKTNRELIERSQAICREMEGANEEAMGALQKEFDAIKRELETRKMAVDFAKMSAEGKDANAVLREVIADVRANRAPQDQVLMRSNSQSVISSGVPSSGDVNNMTSAGLPVTIKDLINPLEMDLIYNKLGIAVATGVRGTLQWPCLDSTIQATVNGELAQTSVIEMDFSKIQASPAKLSIPVEVSNEAINDAAFDLVGTITAQMNKGLGRTLNARVLQLGTTLPAQPQFIGPLMKVNSGGTALEKRAQAYSFTGSSNTTDFTTKEPTYKDLKKMKGKVLKTGAQMNGFCYVMDAATYSFLEAQPRDTGSGRFCIEGGMIDGDPVFVTNISDYAKKIVAGNFAYVALNFHGPVHFIVDPYSKADKNVVRFVLNCDASITTLVSSAAANIPFVIGE